MADVPTKNLHNLDVVKKGSMVFTQTDDKGLFIMDASLTYGQPDPPTLGTTTVFHLGGVWTEPVDLDHLNFKCKIYNALAYDEDFADQESLMPAQWTFALPFEIPKVAPETTYFVTIQGID